MGDPSEIRSCAFEPASHRFHQQWNAEDRATQVLHGTATDTDDPGHLANESRQARAIAGGMFSREGGFARLSTRETLALVQPPMGHLGTNHLQLDHLMSLIGTQVVHPRLATTTGRGQERYGGRRLQQNLSMTGESLGIATNTPDVHLWRLCQERGIVLITGNRNKEGAESPEATIEQFGTPKSLLVLTIGEPQRIFSKREYAHQTAEPLLEYLDGMENLRGTGRIVHRAYSTVL